MISIVYLVSQYPTFNHTFVLREIRALRTHGFTVKTISIRSPDRTREQLTDEEREEAEATLYVLPSGLGGFLSAHLGSLLRRPLGYLGGLMMALRLAGLNLSRIPAHLIAFAEAVVIGSWIARTGIAHVHTHFSSNAALLAVRMFPLTFSMTIHGPEEFNDVVGFHLAEKIARSRFACSISNFGRSQMLRASPWEQWGKIESCYLGVDPTIFAPRPERQSPDPYRILSVGRLAPVKAHHVLIEAVAMLIGQGRRVELWLAGEGPERGSLERHVQARGLREAVHFTGALAQPEVRALYQETDCFAMASFAEGVPVVLMEAMAMEIPCVATWVMGVPELIRHEVDGLLVPPSDTVALAQQIARLMDDRALSVRLGKAGRSRVVDCFNLEKNSSQLAEIFRRHLDLPA